MKAIYQQFIQYFDDENKEKSVSYIMEQLENNNIDVIELYTDILTPALNNMTCTLADQRICIWKEHIKTAIIRTIVECSYPYVIAKRNELKTIHNSTAVVLCPPEESHDLGARMVSDFLTINGFQSIYVGSNTPYSDFFHAIDLIKPRLIAISVSNYYNLVATKKMIEELRSVTPYPLTIMVGGNAFNTDPSSCKQVGADYYARTYDDITSIAKGVEK